MGVGDSQEVRTELKGPLPAGMWELDVAPVAKGPTLHADVLVKPKGGGPETVIFGADSNVGPGGSGDLLEGSIKATHTSTMASGACGDTLVVRVKLVKFAGPTHWHVRLKTP